MTHPIGSLGDMKIYDFFITHNTAQSYLAGPIWRRAWLLLSPCQGLRREMFLFVDRTIPIRELISCETF